MISRIPAFSGYQHPVHFARKNPVQQPQAVQFGATSRAAMQEPRLVSVTGSGIVERMPDTMNISLSLQENGEDRATVTQNLNRRGTELVEKLKDLKLPETVRIRSWYSPVNATYEWDRNANKQKRTGYAGSFQVAVTEKDGDHKAFPEHAASIKRVADDLEAPFSGPHYDVSDRDEAELEALGKAVEDARAKAQKVAGQLNFELDEKPASVEIGTPDTTAYHGGGGMRAMSAMAEGVGGGGQASAESFQIAPIAIGSEQVRVRFSIKA